MADAKPTISLVTCSYQQGRYLESTIRSVIGQGYPGLEYIVVDGGSTDETQQILQRYRTHMSACLVGRDNGQTDALRKGFTRAGGDILGWLCSDDLLLNGALEKVGLYFSRHPEVDVVYGDALWIDASGDVIRPKMEMPFSRFVLLNDHNYIPQPSTFWRRSVYDRVGGLDEAFALAMDFDLWERFSRVTTPHHMAEYLSGMRWYPEQKTMRLSSRRHRENATLRRRQPPVLSWRPVWPVSRAVAKAARILAKARIGGYRRAVPGAHLDWLRTLRIPDSAW